MRYGTDDELVLRDGRRLAFAEHGDPSGSPVVFFHGLGHDRRAVGPDVPGVRMLCIDRPGIGASDRRHERSVAAFARDLEELLDALGLETVRVLAWSAGAPYALACCATLGARIGAATIAAGMVPPSAGRCEDPFAALMLKLAGWSPRAVATPVFLLRLQAQLKADLLLRTLFANVPGCDRDALNDPAIRPMFRRTYGSATARGIGGVLDDLAQLTRAWDVDLSEVDGAAVTLLYGELDRLTPPAAGRGLSALLPGSTLRVVPDAGHMHLWTRWGSVVAELVGRGRSVAVAA